MATRNRIHGVPEVAVQAAAGGRDLAITVHIEMEKYHLMKDKAHGGILTRRRPSPPPGFKRAIAKSIQALVDGLIPFADLTAEQATLADPKELYEL